MYKFYLILLVLVSSTVFSEDVELAKITFVKKEVLIRVNGKSIIPKVGEMVSLNSRVETGKKGKLEFEYKNTKYTIGSNSKIIFSEVVRKDMDKKNFHPKKPTDAGGVRGLDK